jgi:hypothetical protein
MTVTDRLTLAEMQVPPPDEDSGPLKAEKPAPCEGCHGYHGSIGAERNCLIGALRGARAALRAREPKPA